MRLSRHAMATRFELLLSGGEDVFLRAAGEEALREVERMEALLSFYRPDSEICQFNRRAGRVPLQVTPPLFHLLRQCREYTRLTDGAFDVTVGPLMRAWRFLRESGAIPEGSVLEEARARTGIGHLRFDEATFTIGCDVPGVEIDLGGFGKGYAVDLALRSLRENGVTSALLHGGTSSVGVVGRPPDREAWSIELQAPFERAGVPIRVDLVDAALSVSAVRGKSFRVGEKEYGHVLNPGTGRPVEGGLAAAASGPSASLCEVLSTALLVNGPLWLPVCEERFPEYRGYVVAPHPQGGTPQTFSTSDLSSPPSRPV
jgi:thiamine biosynthesis lipoprotein